MISVFSPVCNADERNASAAKVPLEMQLAPAAEGSSGCVHEGQVSAHTPTSITFAVGLDGREVTFQIEKDTSFESLLQDISKMPGAPADSTARVSSCGAVITSMEALRAHCSDGDSIHATFYKDVDQMSLADVAEELACDDDEFKGHQFTLLKLPSGSSARAVADYLWDNQLLITSVQAQTLFDQLLPKMNGARKDLIVALHSFCVQQHHVWEPCDGSSECLWANMTWRGSTVEFRQRRLTRGALTQWEVAEAAEASSDDHWPSTDLCKLKDVAKARRAQHSTPLLSMEFLKAHGKGFRHLQ